MTRTAGATTAGQQFAFFCRHHECIYLLQRRAFQQPGEVHAEMQRGQKQGQGEAVSALPGEERASQGSGYLPGISFTDASCE